MNLIVKRLSDEVESLRGSHIIYVQTESGTNVKALISKNEQMLSEQVQTLKSEYDIKQVIYFDL